MVTKVSELVPFQITAGVQPSTDMTESSTVHYTYADKIRFVNGLPEKLGGWVSVGYDYGTFPEGVCRSLFSSTINNQDYLMLGTHTNLYSLVGTRLTNVTPLSATTTTIANAITTDYATLASDPITTVSGSGTFTVADTNAQKYIKGDTITLSGSSDVGGIPAASINTAHTIRSIGTGYYTVTVSDLASSSTTGGGASVVRASGRLTFSAASHGQLDGDRVKILAAATTGGVTNTQINLEFIVRNVATGTFDVMTAGTATSAVTGGGGASTTYQKQIPEGAKDESYGYGYGMGLYGMGLYGTALVSVLGRRYPRIWFFDRFAETIIMTAGNQTGLYYWNGSNAAAPVLLSGAPTAINYAFVSNNIVVTLGASGVNNHILASDQGVPTTWVASSTNQVFEDYIEGAGRFVSHAPAAGHNLLFTANQTYKFSYIGLPLIWSTELIDNNIGIIAPLARCVVNGIVYWMGQDNFYQWDGSNITVVPANTQGFSTMKKYIFENLTAGQKSKVYCWYNTRFNEIWWHYPSATSNDPDKIARFNIIEKTWVPDTMDRLAAEYPNNGGPFPRLIDSNGILYCHEDGHDDDYQSMPFVLRGNKRISGKNNQVLSGIFPDSIQTGNINIHIDTYLFPQSTTKVYSNDYTVTPTTDRVSTICGGRVWQMTISGDALGQYWKAGSWGQYLQEGSTV